MAWNYDDNEVNGVIDSNIKDAPPNPPGVNTAATMRSMLKLYWAVIRSQVSKAINDIDLFVATTRTAIDLQINNTVQSVHADLNSHNTTIAASLANTLTAVEIRAVAAEAKADSVFTTFSLAKFQGKWNPTTNLPTLVAAPSSNGVWYEMANSGTSNITGTSEVYAVGDRLIGSNTSWFRIPLALIPSNGSVSYIKLTPEIQQSLGNQEALATINGKDLLYALQDSNEDVVMALYKDGSTSFDYKFEIPVSNGLSIDQTSRTIKLKFGQIEGNVPFGSGTVQSEQTAYINNKQAIYVLKDSNDDVVFVIYEDGTSNLMPADFASLLTEIAVARGLTASINERLAGVISDRGLPTTPIWGIEKLRRWTSWKRQQDYRYDLVVIGDSFVQGNYFIGLLRTFLIAEGYLNGGAGYCGFSRYGATISTANQAATTALVVSYTISDWAFSVANNFGVEGYITSSIANTVLTLTANEVTNNVTLIYEKHPSAGDFRYKVNAGEWITVSTASATQDIGNLIIDTSGAGSAFTIQVEALAAGVILCGAIGRNTGNVLTLHKAGISGGTASLFGVNALWSKTVELLTPKAAIIMFTTNEMNGNVTPAAFKVNVQAIITKLRTIDPMMDLILGVPTFTKYETEDPRTYSLKDYASILFQLAQENHTAFVNHALALGAFSQAVVDAAFTSTDRVHPGTRGKYLIADNFFRTLKK